MTNSDEMTRAKQILTDVYSIRQRLFAFYTEEEIGEWLTSKNKLLNDEKAIDLIYHGRTKEVLEVVKQLESLDYL